MVTEFLVSLTQFLQIEMALQTKLDANGNRFKIAARITDVIDTTQIFWANWPLFHRVSPTLGQKKKFERPVPWS